MNTRFILNRKSYFEDTFHAKDIFHIWKVRILHGLLPLLIGLGLGAFMAFLINREAWHFLIAAILFVPAAMLLNRYPFAAILIWILVFPFFVETPTSAGRYIFWILHRALIPATLGFVILTNRFWNRKKHELIRPGPAEMAMVIFLLLVVLNILLFSTDTTRNLYHLYDHVFIPFCMYWLVRLTAPKEEDWKRLCWVAFFGLVIQTTIGLLAWFSPEVLPAQWLGRQGSRTTGTLGNPAVYSTTLVFLSLLLFQQAMQSGSGKLRALLYFLITLGFFGVFLTFSRGSWLAGGVVLLGLLILYPKASLRLMVIMAVLALILGTNLLADEVSWASKRLNAGETAEGRIILFNTGLRMIEAKPLFGWGYGNYDRYDNQFKTAVGEIVVRSDSTSHNTYLTIMAEFGLIAFLFYVLPFVYWLMQSIKVWGRLPQYGIWSRRTLSLLWLVIIAHIVVSNFMDMIRFHEFGTTIWWLTLGLIANLVHPFINNAERRALGLDEWV